MDISKQFELSKIFLSDKYMETIISEYYQKHPESRPKTIDISVINPEFPLDMIISFYKKYQVIVLRNPYKSVQLLVGDVKPKYVSIDTNITKNPTIVADLDKDKDGIIRLFRDFEFKFRGLTLTKRYRPHAIFGLLNEIMISDFDTFGSGFYYGQGYRGFMAHQRCRIHKN
jgi:hypothetical protein